MMGLLAEAVFRPQITDDELSNARQTILYEMEDLQMRPDKESVILEMIHEASWSNNTLGFSRFCGVNNVEEVTRAEILKFMKTYYVPERMVVSGVGVDHSELVDLTKEYFALGKSTWNMEGISSVAADESRSEYTGGEIRVLDLLIIVCKIKMDMKHLAYYVLSYVFDRFIKILHSSMLDRCQYRN